MVVGAVTTLRTRMPGLAGDTDGGARIAGVRRERRDRWRAHATGIARDGEQIADGVVIVCRDIPLAVDHLRQPTQVVIDVLRLVSGDMHQVNEQHCSPHETNEKVCDRSHSDHCPQLRKLSTAYVHPPTLRV